MAPFRVVGIDFDHMHMGDNLRLAFDHPDCRIAGVCDARRERMAAAVRQFGLTEAQVFDDADRCMSECDPDLVILCPATAAHGEWVGRLAPYGKPILLEKPFADSTAAADRMIADCEKHGVRLAINWPLAWYPSHRTAKRLIDEGTIGRVVEVHYYDGNRGPLWHAADKVEKTAQDVAREKPFSWFYRKSAGGGSLLDYLGYGTTLATWFLGGAEPLEVTAVVGGAADLEVDEHSITIARYEFGLLKFETRWGTFTDPWTHQPQPKCGFVLVGERGTVSSYDFEPTVRVQTVEHPQGRDIPVDSLRPPLRNPVEYLIDRIRNDAPIEGPLAPAISRIGQRIVDAAVESALEKRAVPLPT